jgi:hypothetical protein
MRATGLSRTLRVALLMTVMAALSAGTAIGRTSPHHRVAQVQGSLCSVPKTVSKTSQPSGKRQKASSFAPHPTTRRVFGAPIQAPIFKNVPPPKTAATSRPK